MKISSFILILSTLFSSVGFCQSTEKSVASHEDLAAKKVPVVEDLADYDYAWDQFAHRGRLVWDCRGLQSGRVVGPEFCVSKEMVDTHWQDKKIPWHWKP
jgi:hypothetical protein